MQLLEYLIEIATRGARADPHRRMSGFGMSSGFGLERGTVGPPNIDELRIELPARGTSTTLVLLYSSTTLVLL